MLARVIGSFVRKDAGPLAMTEGQRFGAYELVRRLGTGGMAETFLAVRRGPEGFEQRVCLKRILPAFEQDQEFVRLFLTEAHVSARLRHANIAQVVDFGLVEGSHYLVLELVEGSDLRKLLSSLEAHGERLTTGLVSHIAYELGSALEFAHAALPDGTARGVVHRDLSPSNVLLSDAGEVKLSDFGIAKAMDSDHATRTGMIKGKLPYMAPEYAREGRYDARSDLYALGVVLYECLTGTRPHDGRHDVETLARKEKGQHVPLAKVAPHAPAELARAIERLLRPDPDARFATAARFLDALDTVAPPPTARRILGEVVRRHAGDRESGPPTRPGGAHGTVAVTNLGAPSGPAPVAAPPDARTRTRLPNDGSSGD